MNSTEYLSLPQVAAELKCSVRTVRRYLADGRLGYSQEKKGGIIRVSREDIAAYYQASRRGPTVSRRRPTRAAA
ncbi:helix-turn-helix domain-containing protein [Streptomyces scabiei]|uniref:helix-turn-helix domain-containing protein n=1 Tax=Streptomyces scabiei TaxID=1930 RepID=UPI0029AF7E89|nr:helix-turn-helix domain-containing protein [Streptomyces scabiei]MDX3520781.1 helix-turn-helix domain-containing protein [Streptomyces scabiei]